MIKQGVVKLGTTPSAVSGKPSTDVDRSGEPVADQREKQACDMARLPVRAQAAVKPGDRKP